MSSSSIEVGSSSSGSVSLKGLTHKHRYIDFTDGAHSEHKSIISKHSL